MSCTSSTVIFILYIVSVTPHSHLCFLSFSLSRYKPLCFLPLSFFAVPMSILLSLPLSFLLPTPFASFPSRPFCFPFLLLVAHIRPQAISIASVISLAFVLFYYFPLLFILYSFKISPSRYIYLRQLFTSHVQSGVVCSFQTLTLHRFYM